eukprot:3585753-Rhodomonas_salina.3
MRGRTCCVRWAGKASEGLGVRVCESAVGTCSVNLAVWLWRALWGLWRGSSLSCVWAWALSGPMHASTQAALCASVLARRAIRKLCCARKLQCDRVRVCCRGLSGVCGRRDAGTEAAV